MNLSDITTNDFADWLTMRVALYGELEPGAHEAEMLDIHARDDWHLWFLLDEQGQRIGMVELSLRNVVDGCLSSPVAYVEGLYIVPEQRNKGLGKQVMHLLFDWAAAQDYSEMALNTPLPNSGSQRFYAALGFSENERVVEYRITLPQ